MKGGVEAGFLYFSITYKPTFEGINTLSIVGQWSGPLVSGNLIIRRRRPREIQAQKLPLVPVIITGEQPIPRSDVMAFRLCNSAANYPARSGTTGKPKRSKGL